MSLLPKARPQCTREQIEEIIRIVCTSSIVFHQIDEVYVVAQRGYYKDTMGKPGVNDRGIYDDALSIISPTLFSNYNGNCDPSRYRPGFGFGAEKGMASLTPGVWRFKPGIHYGSNPHSAFRQDEPFTVHRDSNKGSYQHTGMFGINLHRGGVNGTSSLGCQTVPPAQWDSFRDTLNAELKRHGQKTFKYVLVEV